MCMCMCEGTRVQEHCSRQKTAQLHSPRNTFSERLASATSAEQPFQAASASIVAEVLDRALDAYIVPAQHVGVATQC